MLCYPRSPKATEKNQQTKKKETMCYAYDKKGHYARNCRSKNIVRRQFNAVLKKKSRTENRKNWKYIDYENTKISTICFENEEFFKIDKLQDFQNVLNETKQANIFTTADVNQTISTFKYQSIIENNFGKLRTSYSNSTKKTKISHNLNCNHESDKDILANKRRLQILDKVTDIMKKTLRQNASRKQSISTKLKKKHWNEWQYTKLETTASQILRLSSYMNKKCTQFDIWKNRLGLTQQRSKCFSTIKSDSNRYFRRHRQKRKKYKLRKKYRTSTFIRWRI